MSDLIITFWLKFGSSHVDRKKFVNNSVIPGEFRWKIEFSPYLADVSVKNSDFAKDFLEFFLCLIY